MAGKKGQRYSDAIRLQLREMYRSGRFESVDKLLKYCRDTKLYAKVPSPRVVTDWIAADGGWSKGEEAPVIAAEIRKTTAQMFVEAGLPKDAAIKELVTGITEAKPSSMAKLAYLQEYFKLTGEYPATKTKNEHVLPGINDETSIEEARLRVAKKLRGLLSGRTANP
jgi:hypothetical protein